MEEGEGEKGGEGERRRRKEEERVEEKGKIHVIITGPFGVTYDMNKMFQVQRCLLYQLTHEIIHDRLIALYNI